MVGPDSMAERETSRLRRPRLRHLLFLLLLLSGLVPLAVSSFLLIQPQREQLETQEKSSITRAAQLLSVELDNDLIGTRRHATQLGDLLLAMPDRATETMLRQPWLLEYLQNHLEKSPDTLAVRVLTRDGRGVYSAATDLPTELLAEMDAAFNEAHEGREPVYRFHVTSDGGEPVAILAVPVAGVSGEPEIFVQVIRRLERMKSLFSREAETGASVLLVGRQGNLLWEGPGGAGLGEAIVESRLVQDFVGMPLAVTQEVVLEIDGRRERMIGRIGPVEEAGWGVVVHRPASQALAAVNKMVYRSVVSTGVLVVLALVMAAIAARKLTQPIQKLAETTHEIATGNFGQQVEALGPGREITELAQDFNRMSGYVQGYVKQLREAAKANQELFIGFMRSFVAAIDAKDPYLRGHSERVAAFSHTISKYLGLPEDAQQRVWVGALLHDVGKIGIDDRILSKGGVLTEEEYEEMKLHPLIGAEIMGRIERLKQAIPIIRSHHEAWNGKGYPDGLEGEDIPLTARIVGVADTFDAITTNRPYQRAYDTDFAVERIIALSGVRFDERVVAGFLKAHEAGEIRRASSSPPDAPPTQKLETTPSA